MELSSDIAKSDLNYSVLRIMLLLLASLCFSHSLFAGEIDKKTQKRLVLEISRSSVFKGYWGARGISLIKHHAGGSFRLRKTWLAALDDKQLAEEGYTNIALYTYVWKGGKCTILFPVRIEKDKVLKIGYGSSDGGCGE